MLKQVEKSATKMANRAASLGFTSAKGAALVPHQMGELLAAAAGFRNLHAYEASLKTPAGALEPITTKGSENEYRLKANKRGCWVMLGGFSVHVYLTDEGVVSDIFAENAENESVASTYAFFSEAEAALAEELQVDLDSVAEWVGLHYSKNFETETPLQRREWIKRFADSGVRGQTELEVLEEIGYDIRPDSDQPGLWIWTAPTDSCEISYDTKESAIQAAWQDATGQARNIAGLSPKEWDSLAKVAQIKHILALNQA